MNIKNLKKIIMMFFFISVSIFANCKENGNKMKFSFEEIQDLYLQEMKQTGANNLCPFYINKNFLIASRFVRNFSEKSHSNQAAFCSFSKSIFCSRRVSALM